MCERARSHHDLLGDLRRAGVFLPNVFLVFVFLPGAEVHRVFGDVAGEVWKREKTKIKSQIFYIVFL